jgi:PII-like signaling protein
MIPTEEGQILRIFMEEARKYEGIPLYEWIVKEARKHKLAGATVLRGLEGFGLHHKMHTAKILSLSSNLPIIIEIIDRTEKIDAFFSVIDPVISEGLVTIEKVRMKFYHD